MINVTDQSATSITLMSDDQAFRWAWDNVKPDFFNERWTAIEEVRCLSLFQFGWNYRDQLEKQRPKNPPPQPSMSENAQDPTPATASVQLQTGQALYMLSSGGYESSKNGPYLGNSGLDFDALATAFRKDRHAQAEASAADYVFLGEEDFLAWLLDKNILTSVKTTQVNLPRLESDDQPYCPKHWPACPACNDGRGDPCIGTTRKSLNRIEVFNRCIKCAHEWGHTDEAFDSTMPMLEDDGRDTIGGCAPFAISKACALDFKTVLDACTRHGWNPQEGIAADNAIAAARELGFVLTPSKRTDVGGSAATTLKRLLAELPRDRNFVAGTTGHWLAIVAGDVVDNDSATGLGNKVRELYEATKL